MNFNRIFFVNIKTLKAKPIAQSFDLFLKQAKSQRKSADSDGKWGCEVEQELLMELFEVNLKFDFLHN